MTPAVRTTLALVALVLATLVPAGGPNKGNNTGIWIIPSCVPLVDLAGTVAAHDLSAAVEVIHVPAREGDVRFRVPTELADCAGTVSVAGAVIPVAVDGLFVRVPASALAAADVAGERFVDLMVTDGVNACAATISLLPEGYRIYVY